MRFIRLATGYLSLLIMGVVYLLLNYSIDHKLLEPQFAYHKDHCTLYCETHRCPHESRFGHYYPAIQAQVELLHRLPVGYRVANLLVYVIGYSLLVYLCIAYLVSFALNGVRVGLQLILFASVLLGGVVVGAVVWPGDQLFWALVNYCLRVGDYLELSLVDTYTVIFVFILPAVLATLLVLVVARALYTHFFAR